MPIVNELTVKFKNGYVVVEHSGSIAFFGRRQGTLEMGSLTSDLAAAYYGLLQLQTMALPQAVPDVDYLPRSIDEVPYFGFRVGDRITSISAQNVPEVQRVQSVTISEDAEGSPEFGVTTTTPLQDAVARISRIIRRAGEAGQGQAQLASPATFTPAAPANQRGPALTPFSLPGPVYVTAGGVQPIFFDCRVISLYVTAPLTGGGVNLGLTRNGDGVAGGLFPDGAGFYDIPVNVDYRVGDTLGVIVTGVSGTPPSELLVTPRISA